MISFVENKNIDRNRWDSLISHSPNGNIFAYSWFLDITSQNWDALIENDYKFIFPIPCNKKYSYSYIHQPLFSNQLGVFSNENISEDKVNEFLKSIPSRFRYIELGLNCPNKTSAAGFKINQQKVQYVDLNRSYDELKNNYDENLKRNLRKAEKAALTVRENVTAADVTNYFRMGRGNEIGHYSDEDYQALTQLTETAIKRKAGFTLGVYDENNNLVAAASFLNSHNRILFLKGAPSPSGRETGAMHLIFDSVIRRNVGKTSVLDFGGSNISNLARFYKSFGADEYLYQHVKRNRLPVYLRWLKK
jgi:hypothetical protein